MLDWKITATEENETKSYRSYTLFRQVATGIKKPGYKGAIRVRLQNHSLLPMLTCSQQYTLSYFVLGCLTDEHNEAETPEQSLCAT